MRAWSIYGPASLLFTLSLGLATSCASDPPGHAAGGSEPCGEQPYYADEDGDGYGLDDVAGTACSVPEGHVSVPGDCNDQDAAIHPEATETCNGLDDDCDSLVDDADDSLDPDSPGTWHPDNDGDGYGAHTGIGTVACEAPSGMVDDDEDCDDDDASIHPLAQEVCDEDDVDEDCDGLADDDDDSTDTSTMQTLYADADGDGWGDDSAPGTLACDYADAHVESAGDCDDTRGTVYPGSPEICDDGLVNDCAGSLGASAETCRWSGELSPPSADVQVIGDGGYMISRRIAAGDTNGDGIDDLFIGASYNLHEPQTSAVYIHNGPLTSGTSDLDGPSGVLPSSEMPGFSVGLAVGDVDGDGYADLWVGSPGEDLTETDAGAAWLAFGPVSHGEIDLLASLEVQGGAEDGQLGTLTHIMPDVDGDGYAELLVGASAEDVAGQDEAGAVYLYGGALTGTLGADDQTALIVGNVEGQELGKGRTVEGSGDLDGDGVPDLVIGAPYTDDATVGYHVGAVYVFLSPLHTRSAVSEADATLSRADTYKGWYLGSTVRTADFDDDGYDDLFVGARGARVLEPAGGQVALILGPLTAGGDLEDLATLEINGENRHGMGGDLALGDFDGDGGVDLLVGGGDDDFTGDSSAVSTSPGEVWLYYSGATGTLNPSDADATLIDATGVWGVPILALGDQDGNGTDDVVLGQTNLEVANYELFLTPGL